MRSGQTPGQTASGIRRGRASPRSPDARSTRYHSALSWKNATCLEAGFAPTSEGLCEWEKASPRFPKDLKELVMA
jgi:hypothetical protein